MFRLPILGLRNVKFPSDGQGVTYNASQDKFEWSRLTMVARYTTNAGQTITNATTEIINYEDIDFDPDSLVTIGAAWKFTATEAGYYYCTARLLMAQYDGWAIGEVFSLSIYKNNGLYCNLHRLSWIGGGNLYASIHGSDLVDLAIGDFMDFRVYQASGSPGGLAIHTDPAQANCAIFKV